MFHHLSELGLGRVHTNSAEMLSSRHGDYRSSVRTHSAGPAGSARQRQTAELAGAQRDPVCRRAGAASGEGCRPASAWHTVYTRMNRWSKNGVLDRVFEHLQREQIVRSKLEAVSLDSTIVKVHPDGTGALWQVPSPSISADAAITGARPTTRRKGVSCDPSGPAMPGPVPVDGPGILPPTDAGGSTPKQCPPLGHVTRGGMRSSIPPIEGISPHLLPF